MSEEEKREFTFTWKIKHLFMFPLYLDEIKSPSFEFEFSKDYKWNLVLRKRKQKILTYIKQEGYSSLPEPIPIDYQYELTTSAGDVLKTSDVLSYTFSNGDFSDKYELLGLDSRNTPNDVFLRCRMVIPCTTQSMKSSPCSVVGWEAETDIVNSNPTFEFSESFSGSNKWTAVERVTVVNIPIDITFKYVDDELQIELFSKIKDKTSHTVWCSATLKESQYVEYRTYVFSSSSGVLRFPSSIKKKNLERSKCFILNKINMRVDIRYLYNSSISEIKSFHGDCTAVGDTEFSLKKDGSNCLSYLQQHLRNMLNEKICADVKLCADDEFFFAHKGLLGARSPVFRDMFEKVTLESKTNIIEIQDVKAKTFKKFLEYLYTGAVDGMEDEMALSLLVVADRYQVMPLSGKCSTFLMSVLSLDNVLNVLSVADMVNQVQLKAFAVEFCVENSSQVLSLNDWSQWMKINPTIASEILLKLPQQF